MARVYDLAVRWAWLLALAAAGVLLFWLGRGADGPRTPPLMPLPERAGFAGSARCIECHGTEHGAWAKTGHAVALRGPEAALGAFDGKAVGTSTPRREGATLSISVGDRNAPGNHRVTHTVGGRVEQAYLTTDAQGAWRLLPLAWNVGRKAWDETCAVYTALTGDTAPGDARAVVFNAGCAPCHATGFDAGYKVDDEGRERLASTMAEPGVSCEACHGKGSVHVQWHTEKREGAYAAPAKLSGGGSGACLSCHYAHEWRYALPDDPDAPFEDAAVSRNFDGVGFFPDGRLAADRYAGTTFVQSKCAKGGATCLSCHAVHGEAKPAGDAQCTTCHAGLAGKEHTFHADVRCADCHMPRLLGPPVEKLRDHSLRSPEPLLTERFQVPNACSACHTDKDARWAREWKEKWWGPADEAFAAWTATIADLRQGAVDRERLAGMFPEAPLFFRASALRALPQGDPLLRGALGAEEIDLLQVACEALADRPDPLAGPALVDLLLHRAPTVRIEAAHALARGGWRAALPRPALRADAQAMLVRQYPATPLLLRAAYVLDAVGSSDEMAKLLGPILARSPREAAPLVQRHGRALAEAGKHREALQVYADARGFFGESVPGMLFLDTADSLAATGDAAGAGAAWKDVTEHLDPATAVHAVARARLLGGEEGLALLRPLEAQFARDLLGGEMLRRVRWSLDALAKR